MDKLFFSREHNSRGQGILEAWLIFLGIFFIFIIAFPQIVSKGKGFLQERLSSSVQKENENSPLCGEIIVIPSAQGRAPFKVVLIGTGRQTKFPIQGFQWDFEGDGEWDTEVMTGSQDFIFETPGNYSLKMLVFDQEENSRLCEKEIKVTDR